MHLGLKELERFLDVSRAEDALVLAMVVGTEGSTYRKPGAMMLIRADGHYGGLISGGCLEGDLLEHAGAVFGDGQPRQVTYDLATDAHSPWGLGLGCGGVVKLLLLRLDRSQGFGFLPWLFDRIRERESCRMALVSTPDQPLAAGTLALIGGQGQGWGDEWLLEGLRSAQGEWPAGQRHAAARWTLNGQPLDLLLLRIDPPPRVLICGGGPDAVPLVRLLLNLGWNCAVNDHRPAFARPERFPDGCEVLNLRPADCGPEMTPDRTDAVVIMSHNLEHDAAYLSRAAPAGVAYIGLLGPRARREQLQAGLEDPAVVIHGPAGLDIGAELPESIALSVAAEIHAVLSGRRPGGD